VSPAYALHATARAFRAPSRIWFGVGASGRIAECVQEIGVTPGAVFLVMDPVVERFGLTQSAAGSLLAAGFELHRYSDIPGEPSVEVADAAVASARRLAPALVVGIGGGSAMDVAKLSAALVRNPGSVFDYTHFVGKRFAEPAVPAVLVPTTAGTGAEASQNAVVTRGNLKAFANNHPQLLAAAALLDPQLTFSLPPKVTAETGLDALSHCIEGILSTNASALTDAAAVHGIGCIMRSLPLVYRHGDDGEARAAMMLGAYMGGLALNAGMVVGHSIAYTIANRLHCSHGFSCALALPYAMAYNRGPAASRLALAARAAGLGDTDAIAAVQGLSQDVGIPESLRALGLERGRLAEMVEECLAQYPRPNNPHPLDAQSLLSLYAAMWEGRPAEAWQAR
jgi:alcohol dehydrogenase class IV